MLVGAILFMWFSMITHLIGLVAYDGVAKRVGSLVGLGGDLVVLAVLGWWF